jgi:mannonate dehydratase
VRLALVLHPLSEELMRLAVQIGVTDIVASLPPEEQGPIWERSAFERLRKRVEGAGLTLSVIESILITDRIKLGLPGSEEELENFCQSLRNMGAAGIPILCYNWMAVMGWMRTSFTVRSRGGALVSAYNHHLLKDAPLTEYGVVTEEQLWDNFEAFLGRVVPAAEEAGVKLALHPDDPPLSPVRGIARIITNPDAYERVFEMVPSEVSGMTYCQGNFAAMGENLPANIRDFGARGKIHFAHFRDVRGTVPVFEETFHDDGPTDMAECIRAYREVSFDGPCRPDHVPTLESDSDEVPGYSIMGRLHAIGYMKGLMQGTGWEPTKS